MAYATITDLEQRLPRAVIEKAVGATSGQQAYTDAVNAALAAASAEIDSFAATQFKVPLQPSERLETLTVDIAAYRLELKRNVVRESEREAHKEAVKFLEALRDGKVSLDQPAGQSAQTAGGKPLSGKDEDRVFSDTKLTGF